MKLFLDDCRGCPDGYILARGYEECIRLLSKYKGEISEISLDHDLGELRTGYSVCLWIVENEYYEGVKKIRLHSANPVGIKNMCQLLDRYLPKNITIEYKINNDFVSLYRE